MCRLLGWVAAEPMTAREALGEESLAALLGLASLHADGWGVAYDGPEGPLVQRSTERADTDPAFFAATSRLATRVGIVHLRWATPGLPVDMANTHPFSDQMNTFAHNGAIYPVDRLDTILTAADAPRLRGTTDSERYFLAIQSLLDEPGTDLHCAVSRVAGRLARDFRPSSLNALMGSPTALSVICCHDPAAAPNAGAPVAGAAAEAVALDPTGYFDLQYRELPDVVVVASSGIASADSAGWRTIPNDSMLVIDRGDLEVQPLPLHSGLGNGLL